MGSLYLFQQPSYGRCCLRVHYPGPKRGGRHVFPIPPAQKTRCRDPGRLRLVRSEPCDDRLHPDRGMVVMMLNGKDGGKAVFK